MADNQPRMVTWSMFHFISFCLLLNTDFEFTNAHAKQLRSDFALNNLYNTPVKRVYQDGFVRMQCNHSAMVL